MSDPRVDRSTRALGSALIALIQERTFDEITVQDILDRAGVGRTTFYAHFRNKEDVLHSSYDHLFAWVESLLSRDRTRLFPVAEFADHLLEADGFVTALRDARRLDETWAMCGAHAARLIEGRLGAQSVNPVIPRQAAGRMLSGALMELLEWWLDHRSHRTPAELDTAFHALAYGMLKDSRLQQQQRVTSLRTTATPARQESKP